jgi:hypothetical protein
MMKIEGFGSASGSISHRRGSPDPDQHQNVMDPQHWLGDSRWRNIAACPKFDTEYGIGCIARLSQWGGVGNFFVQIIFTCLRYM